MHGQNDIKNAAHVREIRVSCTGV